TALIFAATNGNKEIVELLLSKGADVNAKANNGETALMSTAETNKKEIVKLLLSKGADVNIKSDIGETALSKAELRNHSDIVELLRQAGAINEPPSTVKSSMSRPNKKSSKHTQ
ncbi:MAG: ankyrin repeat domain-containing protein, partial [Candidatus Omnitrophota bacterium]